MPRGIYQRKSAEQPDAKPVKKVAPKKSAPEVTDKAAVAPVVPVAKLPPVIAQAATPTIPEVLPSSPALPPGIVEINGVLRGSVDAMDGDLLKRYAKQVGIHPRDIEGLSTDRLRQNCKVMIMTAMEDA